MQRLDHTLTRRDFTASLAAGAAATMAAPLVRASNKSGLGPALLGEGDHEYEMIHDWLKAPLGHSLGDTHGLAQDRSGRVYVAHTVNPAATIPDAILVFDEKGRHVDSWGAAFKGGAHGLDIRDEGGEEFLYHCDTNRRLVVKTNLKGEVLWQRGAPLEAGVYKDGMPFVPTNVAFAPDGGFYLGDGYGSSYIHKYDAGGKYAATIATPGSGEGQVNCPHGLWVDDRSGEPRLAVADRGNHRIQYLSLDGKHLGFVTEGMRMPCHFKTRDGILLVPDLESVVTLLDKDNKVIVHLGDGHPSSLRGAPREQFVSGKFIHPHTAIFLHNGDILVAEWVPIGRLTLLRKK